MNITGWLVFFGIVILTFIVAWALLTKRPSKEQLDDLGHGGDEHHEVEKEISDHSTDLEVSETNHEMIDEPTLPPDQDGQETITPPLESSDDFVVIEGIGPKISEVLREAGITTFAQLANTDVETLRKILADARLQIADPTSWPEQARLASMDDKTALNELQKQLKGGRN